MTPWVEQVWGVDRTARTTSARMAIPKALKSARPVSVASMAGYSRMASSCANSRTAEGS